MISDWTPDQQQRQHLGTCDANSWAFLDLETQRVESICVLMGSPGDADAYSNTNVIDLQFPFKRTEKKASQLWGWGETESMLDRRCWRLANREKVEGE